MLGVRHEPFGWRLGGSISKSGGRRTWWPVGSVPEQRFRQPPDSITGTAGTFSFVATGYPAPAFTTDGPLPTGVSLSKEGVLSGTPAAGTQGAYVFTVTATNSVNAQNQSFTMNVHSKPTFNSANSTVFVGGQSGNFSVTATGFPTAITYALASGSAGLPAGITLDGSTGILSGTPTASNGTYNVVIEATNAAGSTTQALAIDIKGGTVSSFTPANARGYHAFRPAIHRSHQGDIWWRHRRHQLHRGFRY